MPRKKEGVFKCVRRLIMERIIPGEVPDPVPIHIPGAETPLTLQEEMRRFIRTEISRAAVASEDAESFEESEDFSDDEDGQGDLLSQYTVIELHPEDNDYGIDEKTETKGQDVPPADKAPPEPLPPAKPEATPEDKKAVNG